MKTIATICLSAFLLISTSNLFAQDKYAYATVTYAPSSKVVIVSYNGSEFEKVDVPKGEFKNPYDTNPALKKIAEMNGSGWELFNTSTVGSLTTFVFVLRKKIE